MLVMRMYLPKRYKRGLPTGLKEKNSLLQHIIRSEILDLPEMRGNLRTFNLESCEYRKALPIGE
jgi:hypothetical protein